jgi:Transposase DDE domain group 1
MRVSHAGPAVSAVFDDPNLVSCAGLVPVLSLARRCGLHGLVASMLTLSGAGGVNPGVKVPALVAGMVAGADSIDDMDLLRHGGMGRLFTGVRAPSTLGTFLRSFTFGHVRQLDAVAARFLARLARSAPLLPGADRVAYVDLDDTVRAVHGHAKQGVGFGYTGVRGLNALIATVGTPTGAPVIAATRLRKGSVNSARGAARLVADALVTARAAGAGGPSGEGLVLVRADSAFFTHDTLAAARRGGARFSVTARMNPAVVAAISRIPESAWTAIRYPNAVWEEDEQRWVSDAEVAETAFTAFTGRRKSDHLTARLVVRRVKRLNSASCTSSARAGAGQGKHGEQGELFAAYRHHAVFTDSPEPMLDADTTHRAHAVIEQVIADLKGGPLAHLPSGKFSANAAWLVMAAVAFNLTRAAGAVGSRVHARATTGTLRAQLINVPARLARSARHLVLHLPEHWPWQDAYERLFTAATGPPATAS